MKPEDIADEIESIRQELEDLGDNWMISHIKVSHYGNDPDTYAIGRFMRRAPERIKWLIDVVEADEPEMVNKPTDRFFSEVIFAVGFMVMGGVIAAATIAIV